MSINMASSTKNYSLKHDKVKQQQNDTKNFKQNYYTFHFNFSCKFIALIFEIFYVIMLNQ